MDESEVRANDLAGMISEAEEPEDEGGDLFGGGSDDDDDGDVKMDEGKQESTRSVEGGESPKVQQSRPVAPGSSPSSSSSSKDNDEEQPDDGLTAEERKERRRMEYDEDDGMHEQREMTTVQVKVNKWDPLEGTKQGERYTIRLPKQILHEPSPYSQANYHEPEEPTVEGEDDGESKLNPKEIERRKAETLLHQVEHTMRWRWVQGSDGTMVKKSNTRIIRWSDGSLSLQLGPPSNLFDISSSSTSATTSHNPNHQPTTYIVAHHQEAELLQSEGPITAKLTLVPANLKGDMHQKLAKSVKGRNEKGSRLKIWDEKNMVAAVGEDGLSTTKKVKKTRKSGGPGSGTKRGSGGGGGGGGRRKRAPAKRSGSIDSDEEDSSEEEEMEDRRRGVGKKSGRKGTEDVEGKYQEDGFVVDDSGSGNSDDNAKSSSKSKKGKGGKQRRASPTMSSDDEAEAVESEEEEDVREVESEEMESEEDDDESGGEALKKRRIVLNEEEEEEE